MCSAVVFLTLMMSLPACALRGRGDRPSPRTQLRAPTASTGGEQAQPNMDDPIVQKATQLMNEISGRITVILGVLHELDQLQQAISTVPKGLTSRNFKIEAFRSALRECWGEPVRSVADSEPIPIDYSNCANHAGSGASAAELSQTQLAMTNTYDSVKSCAPPSIAAAKKFPPRTPQSALSFLESKVVEVDAIRILVDQLPVFQEEAIEALSTSSQQIAMLALEVENDPKRMPKNQRGVSGVLNELLEVRARELELELNSLSSRTEGSLDSAQNAVEDMLASYPFMGLP
jgi:hypothetical protein